MGTGSTTMAALAALLLSACAHAPRTASERDAALRRAVARAIAADDSVAVGYGMLHRAAVVGPVGTVIVRRDVDRPRGVRIEELLMGRLPGVDVERLADGDLRVRVRGAALTDDGEPLWIIDGMPMPYGGAVRQFLRDVNAGDVARLDVLRGSAAAVYGSRGSHGVILVTLRRDYRPDRR